MTEKVISVGTSQLFRLLQTADAGGFRIQQAVQLRRKGPFEWRTLAFATGNLEAHGAMHQMQADFLDKMIERQGSFSSARKF